MRWPMGDACLWEIHAYMRHAYEVAYGGCTSMGDARLWEMHAYEGHAYEMACGGCTYGRRMPMRDTSMRDTYEMAYGNARLWETHAYERHAYEMAVYGMHIL